MPNKEQPIRFSPLIFGTMHLGVLGVKMGTNELGRFIDECLDLGLNDFDHAGIYGHFREEGNFVKVLKKK